MRIPLDYYRILGLPIQATSEQLRQAHRDRTLQLPRREYSDAAISARKQLLDQAYAVLSSADQRRAYDSGFLAKTYELSSDSNAALSSDQPDNPADDMAEVDPHTPSIEIEEDQFIGALLILQELGEYELVLKLGRPFLTGGSASLNDYKYGDPNIVFSDIVLTVALACLELGREQWQQGQYENAAEALETGQQLLLREGLFVNVRGEIQADLYRLRPYRILELLALPEECIQERQLGMELLEDMLSERRGIDGSENDQSGLNVDDFLKFIQQLRSYLTAEEQKQLFERESSRPSAVATYLAVYALLAQGFAERQPELVQRAKQYLSPLSDRQDVHLERAICSLLLGQTEEASHDLELSQEQDSIGFIRQHSYSSPDLLPGLCLYTERWFHDEVFPHFRDLAHCRTSLKDYFADRHVQNYLEALPSEAVAVQEQPARLHSVRPGLAQSPAHLAADVTMRQTGVVQQEASDFSHSNYAERSSSLDHDTLIATARARIASRANAATLGSEGRFIGGVSTAERVAQSSVAETGSSPQPRSQWSRSHAEPLKDGESSDTMAARKVGDRPVKSRSTRSLGWLIPASAVLGVILLGAIGTWLFRTFQSSQRSSVQLDNVPLVQLDQPLLTLTETVADPTTITTIDNEAAKQLITAWLTAKSKAMGSTHDTTALDQILVDPKLSEWRSASEEAKQDGWYRNYKHNVMIESVELLSANGQVIPTQPAPNASPTVQSSPDAAATASPAETPSPDLGTSSSPDSAVQSSPNATVPASPTSVTAEQARVIANVTETTETFRNGKADGAAQTEQLRVQYTLVRKDGKWRIQDWQLQ